MRGAAGASSYVGQYERQEEYKESVVRMLLDRFSICFFSCVIEDLRVVTQANQRRAHFFLQVSDSLDITRMYHLSHTGDAQKYRTRVLVTP
jgi:hypothetical protein